MGSLQSQPPDSLTAPPIISWYHNDIEQWVGFNGGRFTRVNTTLPILSSFLMTVIVYSILYFAFRESMVGRMMIDRGFTPYLMMILFFWSLSIVVLKWFKLQLQKQVLEITVIPTDLDFVLSVSTVDQVLSRIMKSVDDSRNFVLFNRIFTVLSNLRNLGRVSDVDEMLRSQADIDESTLETSYSLLRGFIWAIPVLGFIGTVMGLSVAIGGFGEVLSQTSDPSALAASLKEVTGGLSTAFETTLVALLLALALQLLVTFLHKAEEEFLDDCSDYCQRNIVSKLRIFALEMTEVN